MLAKKKVALLNSPSKSHVKFRYILTASSALQKQMQAIIKTFFLFHLINPIYNKSSPSNRHHRPPSGSTDLTKSVIVTILYPCLFSSGSTIFSMGAVHSLRS